MCLKGTEESNQIVLIRLPLKSVGQLENFHKARDQEVDVKRYNVAFVEEAELWQRNIDAHLDTTRCPLQSSSSF